MATDPYNLFNQDINIADSSLRNNQVSQARRDSFQNQSNIQSNTGSVINQFQSIVNTFLPPLSSAVTGVLVNTSKLFRQILPAARPDSSKDAVRFDADCLAAVEQIAHEMHEMSELAKTDFSYRTHATERSIQLQNDRLSWEKAVIEENLSLIRNFQNEALEQKRGELQMQADIHYLPLQAKREDVLELLYQENGKFVIIPSPPKVTNDLQLFQSLNREVSYELKNSIKKYYTSGGVLSAIGYKDIFKGPIEDSHAPIVGKFLSPIPTIIFQSEITYQKVFIWVTITCPVMPSFKVQSSGNDCPFEVCQERFDLEPLNWMNLKRELESQGQDPEVINQNVLELIASIHTVVAISFSDLYCLNLNPCHNPKLFDFLEESKFSGILRAWTEPLQNSLRDAQKKIKEELSRLNEQKIEQSRPTNGPSYTGSDDFGYAPFIFGGLGIMFLFAMYSQQSPQVTENNTGNQSPVEQRQSSQGTSARIEVPISTGYKVANLRSASKDGNKFVIGQLKSGEKVIAYEVSPDGLWRRVK